MSDGNVGTMTSEERIARQELDDGALDDTVWFIRYGATENADPRYGTGARGGAYHEREACPHVANRAPAEVRESTREGAQLRWLAPCRVCVLCTAQNTPPEWREDDVEVRG